MPRSRRALLILIVTMALGPAAAAQDQAVEYLLRRDQLGKADVDGRMALAAWAENHKLMFQASVLYSEVLELEPNHDKAYKRWVAIADRHELPPEDQRIEKLKQKFEGMDVHTTRRFIILYNTDGRWARTRAGLLEKAHDVYFSTFRRVDFRPLPLKRRLVCILFNSHEDYLAYALRVDNARMGWSAGYYSSRTNRIVYFDDRDSPIFKEVVEKKEQLETQADQLRQQMRAERNHAIVMQLRQQLEHVNKQLTWYRNRHEALAKLGNASKTVHEAVHQLAFNSDLQVRGNRYPFWLSEGLATNFETDNPAKAFGPLHPNDGRRAAIQDHLNKGGKLVPLDELVKLTALPAADQERLMLIYNQAWAFFGYAFRYHRDELRQFFDTIKANPEGDRTAEQLHADFVKAFGETKPLERRFERWIRRLK